MDIFAKALSHSNLTCAMVDAGAHLPPSQALAPSQGVARSRDVIDLADECVETADATLTADLTKQALIAHGPEIPGKAKGTKRASSRKDEDDESPKRQCDSTKQLKFHMIKEVHGHLMPCIQDASFRHHLPVPLWGQYRATWRETDLKNTTWILVSSQESWVKGMVNALTNKSVREVASKFHHTFEKMFKTSVTAARKSRNLSAAFSEDEDDDRPARFSAENVQSSIDITIGDFTVTCLNSKKRMALKLDEKTVNFITKFVVPFMKGCGAKSAKSGESAPPPRLADQSQGYQLAASITPNLRDKVYWNPKAHEWKLTIKNPKGQTGEQFVVNAAQPPADYEKEKTVKYWRAVKAWNLLDGSKRHRIPVPPVESQ